MVIMGMETRMQRRRRYLARNWAAMDTDILCSVFSRLPYLDLLRVKSICPGWKDAVELFKSCSATPPFPQIPWLIFTPLEEDEVATRPQGEKTGRFVNIEETQIYPFNDLALKKINDGGCFCTGSSHDWLFCLDRKALPFLLNPFTSRRIDLPSLGVERVYGTGKACTVKLADGPRIDRDSLVRKAVLSSSPSLENNYYLVIICGEDRGLAFCKDGDTSWTQLHSNPNERYHDIIFLKNQLYGIYNSGIYDSSGHQNIRVWDMNQDDGFLVVKNIEFVLKEFYAMPPMTGYRYARRQIYLVQSQESLLAVNRIDSYTDAQRRSRSRSRSRTTSFKVFMLDAAQNLGKMVTCLGGFALFLGQNQSISVDVRNCKMLKQDSIYFTDDDEHDSGVFSLKDSCVGWLYNNMRESQKSVPTWVVPLTKGLSLPN